MKNENKPFLIEQGVRQGGVFSTDLYMVDPCLDRVTNVEMDRYLVL